MSISSTIRQSLAYLSLLIVVTGMCIMSWPRLLASLQFLPVQRIENQLYLPDRFELDGFEIWESRSKRAIGYNDAYPYHAYLSLQKYVQGTDQKNSLFARRESLQASMEQARLALAGAPLQPDLWLSLAQAGVQVFVPANELVGFFKMAIWSGRVEPTHLISRLQIGLSLLRNLDEDGLNLLRDQVLLAWNLKQHEVAKAIRSGQLNYKQIVDLMAATHPDVVREMEETLGPVAP